MMPCPTLRPRALLLAVSTALLNAACGGTSPATDDAATIDAVAAPAEPAPVETTTLAPPDFAEGAINAVAFEGSYACDPGFAPEITLSDDGTTKEFRAFLNQRLLTSGTWTWDGTTLRIESTADAFTFTDIEIGDGTMVLGTGAEQWACRNLPDVTP